MFFFTLLFLFHFFHCLYSANIYVYPSYFISSLILSLLLFYLFSYFISSLILSLLLFYLFSYFISSPILSLLLFYLFSYFISSLILSLLISFPSFSSHLSFTFLPIFFFHHSSFLFYFVSLFFFSHFLSFLIILLFSLSIFFNYSSVLCQTRKVRLKNFQIFQPQVLQILILCKNKIATWGK